MHDVFLMKRASEHNAYRTGVFQFFKEKEMIVFIWWSIIPSWERKERKDAWNRDAWTVLVTDTPFNDLRSADV